MHDAFLRSLQSKLMPLVARAERLAAIWLEVGLAGHDISLADFRIVGALLGEEIGLTQRQLAARVGVQPATLSVAVSKLERAGVVVRNPHPDDARVKYVRLADDLPRLADVELILDELERRALAGVTAAELGVVRRVLARIIGNLSAAESRSKKQPTRGSTL